MHFTYEEPEGDLCQGDVLRRTDALEVLLRAVHPHYAGSDYRLFMVLTQSCDLVQREGSCAARYVTIASVRSLDIVLQRQLSLYQDSIDRRAGVCSDRSREKFLQFIRRLLNNNESEYFFLRRQDDRLADDHCVFLRESVPLRSRDHYQLLLDSRILSLNTVFQAKLGWLVGDMFSRVGTDDWVPAAVPTQNEFDAVANEIANGVCQWIDASKLKQAKKGITDQSTDEEIRERIDGARKTTRRAEVLDRVCAVLERSFPDQYADLKNVRQVLGSDGEIKTLMGS